MDPRSIRVAVDGTPYEVCVGAGVRERVAAATADADRVACVADRRVVELHGALRVSETLGGDAGTLLLDGGEGAKTMERLEEALDFCAEARLSRASALVAYGGGTVGDLAGLAASLFKRGLGVVQVPTTLLAQVDASVGGKTAINLRAGKNLAGTFHQPSAVFCDTAVLSTLPDEEFASGLGEVVKTAIIGGEDVLARIEEAADAVVARDGDALAEVVAACVRVKARVVEADPEERGLRRVLNLGHTFGHAIEHAAGYGRVPHGVAVGVGLSIAARAAEVAVGADRALSERTRRLLIRFGLPVSLDELRDRDGVGGALTTEALRAGLGHDKKGRVGSPEFVLARAAGDVAAGIELDGALVDDLLR
ncbi:MAG: 3-dehydroquinate synthase [Planctomycetota bacterium]